ncbi:MAG: RidA family protein [Desulfobacteraceae bacterium]|nr:RidA family protein [Desulfobacteraceae bacterium]MBC2757226.1 RidA family protein [Desulfobacteraceae bacterium]
MESNKKQPKQTLINPEGTEFIYNTLKFSQAVRVGNSVWVSGQVGMDEKGTVGENIEEQARIAFQNLKKVLNDAGAGLDDIVELVTYHTEMKDMKIFGKVKSEFITDNYPAWTAVGVTELVLPQLMLEVRATAVVGSGPSGS